MGLRVGIVGAGNIARSRHIPTYKNNDRARIIGVHDRDKQRARSLAKKYNITSVPDLEQLFSKADLISICTPPAKHCEQAVEALKNGCHVLTEKPMAMSPAEADDMIAAAENHDRVLSVVHNFLFMDRMRSARNLLLEGHLGSVNRTYGILIKNEQQKKAYLDNDSTDWSGMKFWDEAPHMMYLTRAFIGDMRLKDAETTLNDSGTSYRTLSAQFEGEAGTTGNVSFVWDSPISEWWLVIIGTEGIAFVDIYRDMLIWFDKEEAHSARRVITVLLSGIKQATAGGIQSGLQYIRDRLISGYRIPDSGFSYQVDRLIHSIENGSKPPVTGEESKQILEDMETIVSAAEMDERD